MSNSDFFTQIKKEHIHENINHMWKLAYLLFNIFIKKNTTFLANKHRRKEVFALKTNFKITLYYSQKVIKTFNKFSILSLKKRLIPAAYLWWHKWSTFILPLSLSAPLPLLPPIIVCSTFFLITHSPSLHYPYVCVHTHTKQLSVA